MGSKTKSTQKTNSTQTNAPPTWADPTMQNLAGIINSGVNQVGQVPAFTGDFVAQPGVLQQAVPGGYFDAAAMARSLIPQAQQALGAAGTAPAFDVTGEMLNPALHGFAATNPGGMDAAVLAAMNPVYRNLTEQILPSLQSAGIESGAYGGSRALNTLPAQALRDYSAEAGNIAAQLRYQDFGDTANRILQGYGASTQRGLGEANVLTDRLGLTPDLLDAVMRMSGGAAELQAQGAGYDTANRQSVLDNALQQYQYQIQRPFMGYDIATDLISRLAGNYGTQTLNGTTTTTQKTGGLAPIIGGIMGVANMVAGAGLGMPPGTAGSGGQSLVAQLFGRKPAAATGG